MADEIMGFEKIASLLLDCTHTDDVVGARRLLERVQELDRKSIVAKRKNCNAPLFVAAMRRNVDMVKCLVKEWQADMEVFGRYMDKRDGSPLFVTPLWYAAVSNDMKMVELLLDLGADINAASNTGDSPVSYACFLNNVCIVKMLSMRGADVEKPNRFGETCLIIAAERSLELCQFLIDNGAKVNAQNSSSGNTALHCAIISNNPDKEDIVQLLIDHGSNTYIKNKNGDDAFQTAIIECQDSILRMLLLKFEPPAGSWIKSYELLGACYANRIPSDNEKALHFWEISFEIRKMNSCVDVPALQLNPIHLFDREVNTVEELHMLSQNYDFVRMRALLIFERILGPHHVNTISGLLGRGNLYMSNKEYRRGIDMHRYALHCRC